MGKSLKEQAIMLADYGAKHGNFMYNWVGIREMNLDNDGSYVLCDHIFNDALKEAERRNPDLVKIEFHGGHISYYAYHRMRTRYPELTPDQIWNNLRKRWPSQETAKKIYKIAAQLLRDNYEPLKEYPKGEFIYWDTTKGYWQESP